MATMVMTTPQMIALPTSNGHTTSNAAQEKAPGFHIGTSGLEEEAFEDACNQVTPRKARAAAELPSILFPSFKNPFAGPFTFGSNCPNSSVSTQSGLHDAAGIEQVDEKTGVQPHEDQNGATDSSYDTACNGLSEEESQEKFDLLPVPEPQELANAFPPTFAHSHAADDSSNNNHAPAAPSHPTHKSPSRPSSPYVQGQDVHVNCVQWNPTQGDAVVASTTNCNNTQSAGFTPPKDGYHEQQDQQPQQQHTILTANAHQKSQFLLTISAPSQSGRYEACQLADCVGGRASGIAAAGGAQLEHLLARVKHEKTVSRARAWEEGAKAKVYNRYARDESKITAWENTMKAKAEARMRKAQENLDKQRAKYVEKMKNAVASAHCKAQEKRAAMEARRAEDIVKAEEMAARIRATGTMPRKCLCFPA